MRNVLLHSVPTAYDRFGRCRQYLGPPRPREALCLILCRPPREQAKSAPAQLLEKAEASRIVESFKKLLSGQAVDDLEELQVTLAVPEQDSTPGMGKEGPLVMLQPSPC